MASELQVQRFPALDTGLGREAGYADDRELIEEYWRQVDALDDYTRALVIEADRRIVLAFVEGTHG